MSKSSKEPETIKQKLARLDDLLAWFENEQFEVEQALEKYQQAKQLVAEIETDLQNKRNLIIKL